MHELSCTKQTESADYACIRTIVYETDVIAMALNDRVQTENRRSTDYVSTRKIVLAKQTSDYTEVCTSARLIV